MIKKKKIPGLLYLQDFYNSKKIIVIHSKIGSVNPNVIYKRMIKSITILKKNTSYATKISSYVSVNTSTTIIILIMFYFHFYNQYNAVVVWVLLQLNGVSQVCLIWVKQLFFIFVLRTITFYC